MRRYWLPSVIVVVAVGLIALLAFGLNQQGENLSIDSQVAHGHYPVAPDATVALPMLGSSLKRSIADYRGRVVVLNVFASWCDPCQAEAPTLRREQTMLARRDATVLGVTYEDDAPDAEQFMATYHLRYPVIRDVSGNVVRSFGTELVPETFVLDAGGRIVAVMRGPVTPAWLQRAVAKAFSLSA
jgi:cytochrome c biogenesis protein CcmG/thiol:disulfide interchange protein DsbE